MPNRRIPPEPPPDGADDRMAALREEQELERAARGHRHDEIAQKIIAWGMWSVLIVVFVIITDAALTLGYHMLLPNKIHWLCEQELQDVKNAVLSGVAVALGTTYLRRYIGNRS